MRTTLLFSAILLCTGVFAQAAGKPNVLVILSDDVGWGEFGFQGETTIPTPNIDSIAKNGVRCTQGYVSGPYCSPTRAGFLTGRYQTRFGHEFNTVAVNHGLPLTETTIADRLKAQGYATCAIGKWHLGRLPQYRPTKRGFDEYFGTLANTPFYHAAQFVDSRISDEVRPIEDDSFYTTEQYADRAIDWLGKQEGKPWFLYMPFNAMHAPLQAPQKHLDKFQHIEDRTRRSFSAAMTALDEAVGKVLTKVRDMGQEENTLIVFFSDNGGPTQSTTSKNGPLHGVKATTWEGGVRIPFAFQWKGVFPAGTTYEHPIIQLDLLPTALSAAGASIDPSWKLDGVDLRPFLTGQTKEAPHKTLYWRFGDQWAVRHEDYKLVVANGGSKKPELYNLKADIGEKTDLAAAEPAKLKELQAIYDKWNAEQAPPIVPKEAPANPNAATKKAANKKAAAKKKAGNP